WHNPDRIIRKEEEKHAKPTVDAPDCDLRAAFTGTRRPAADRSRPALHHGVLLQGAMGTSAGIPKSLPEKSLSAAAEEYRKRPHRVRKGRAAGQSRDRRWTLGLPRHHPLQELD